MQPHRKQYCIAFICIVRKWQWASFPIVSMEAQNRWVSLFLKRWEKHLMFTRSRLREGTVRRWQGRAGQGERFFFYISVQLCRWNESGPSDTSLEAISASPPARKKKELTIISPAIFGEESLQAPGSVWTGGCISAPSLWNLLCTLIPPTSSPNICLWVMSRPGVRPKPAFRLSLSPPPPLFSVSSTCKTGSSVSCETARRLRCKRI